MYISSMVKVDNPFLYGKCDSLVGYLLESSLSSKFLDWISVMLHRRFYLCRNSHS